jgi:hypothetical protein
MKPLWHSALEPDIPIRPRMRPAWTSWMVLLLVLLAAASIAYGFWTSSGPYLAPR